MLRGDAQTANQTGQLGLVALKKNVVQHVIPTCSVGSLAATAFQCPHLLIYLNLLGGLNESLRFARFQTQF